MTISKEGPNIERTWQAAISDTNAEPVISKIERFAKEHTALSTIVETEELLQHVIRAHEAGVPDHVVVGALRNMLVIGQNRMFLTPNFYNALKKYGEGRPEAKNLVHEISAIPYTLLGHSSSTAMNIRARYLEATMGERIGGLRLTSEKVRDFKETAMARLQNALYPVTNPLSFVLERRKPLAGITSEYTKDL